MVDRWTAGARAVMAGSYEYARGDGSSEIGAEHLFQALLDDRVGAVLLASVAGQPERGQLMAEIRQARHNGGVTGAETEALAGLGIDVDLVVDRIEQRLGAGALGDTGTRPLGRWRPAVSGPALRVLEEAQRQRAESGGRSLGVEELVLGLVSVPGVVAESLARRGVTAATVRAARPVGRGGRQ